MDDVAIEIAGSVSDAGVQYVEDRWLSKQPEEARRVWRARLYDVIYAAVVHALELHETASRQRRKVLLLWCLKCRAKLKVPRGMNRSAIRCPTCGHVQVAPGQGRNWHLAKLCFYEVPCVLHWC